MSDERLYERIEEASAFLAKRTGMAPRVCVVLGSGLGFIADQMTDVVKVPYTDVPHFKVSTVTGHSGEVVAGKVHGVPALVYSGRVHLYEGHTPKDVAFPLMAAIRHSVRSVLLTNAAGCVWPMWAPGDMMLIRDHINLQGVNVLAGPWDSRLPERFVDLSDLYSARLRSAVKHFAADAGIALREGVYTGFLGPSYETKAEVRMARTLGGDAVGMSTVQEAIAARRFGAEVVGISVITNHAAGVSSSGLSHAEVKENAHKARERIVSLVTGLVPVLDAAAA